MVSRMKFYLVQNVLATIFLRDTKKQFLTIKKAKFIVANHRMEIVIDFMKSTIRYTLVFAAAAVAGVYLHEIGHAVAGWVQGIAIIPTPAKEYVLRSQVEWGQEIRIALGGVVGTVLAVLGALFWFVRKRRPETEAVFAGALLPPGVYTLRFLLQGRGHDGLEWQAAQTILGLSPAGHAIDFFFMGIFIAGIIVLIVHQHAPLRSTLLKFIGLAVGGIILMVVLQVGNNTLFDRFFSKSDGVNVPSGLDPR